MIYIIIIRHIAVEIYYYKFADYIVYEKFVKIEWIDC